MCYCSCITKQPGVNYTENGAVLCVFRLFLHQPQSIYNLCNDREMKECISRAEAVNIKANGLLKSDVDDYKLLSDAMLTFEQIEGVFTRPPPMVTR